MAGIIQTRGSFLAALVGLLAIAGCAGDGYYRQSVSGHLDLMSQRQDIDILIADQATPVDLRQQLELVSNSLAFAAERLALPDNGSYRSFVDLDRSYVTWNVVATPPLSLEPLRWCFPVVGCVSYRGYFEREEAEAFAEGLRAEGYDVAVAGARAYSTLGWFRDPVPSTIIFDAEYDLVGTIFHELSHQRVFIRGDAAFNESYAVAVERAGVALWLAENGTGAVRADYAEASRRQGQFLSLVLLARSALDDLYRSTADEADKSIGKSRIFADLRADYLRLRGSWGGYSGYDGFFSEGLNNARLALVSTYNTGVPAFEKLLDRSAGDWAAFHAEVEAIAALPEVERRAALERLRQLP